MSKTIFVEIIGEASQFQKELQHAVNSTEKANSSFAKMGKVAMVAGGVLATGLAIGLEKSIHAAIDAEKSIAKLDQAFANAHLSVSKYKDQIEAVEASSRQLGFTDDDTRNALARLITATGNVKQAMTDLALAQDVARLKGTDLSSAVQMVTSTLSGNVRAAKALGIVLLPVTENVDALRAKYKALGETVPLAELATAKLADKQATAAEALQKVTDKVHGQADAYSQTAAGAMAQFHAQLQHLEETIGLLLLPVLTRLIGHVNNLLTSFQQAIGPIKSATASLKEHEGAVHALETAMKVLQTVALLPLREAMILWRAELVVARGAVTGVEAAVNALRTAFNAAHNAGSDLVGFLRGAATGAFNAFKGVANGILGVLHAVEGALNAIASAARSVESALSSIHVPHISLPSVGGILSHIPHAAGGPVIAGQSYLVGEKGPELFTSGASGFITPNNRLGGGGDVVVHSVVQLDGQTMYENWKRYAARDVSRNGGTGIRA